MLCAPLNRGVYFALSQPAWENIFPQSPKWYLRCHGREAGSSQSKYQQELQAPAVWLSGPFWELRVRGEPAGVVQSDEQTLVNTDPLPQSLPQGLSQVSVRLSDGEVRHRQFRSITALFGELKPHGSQVHQLVSSLVRCSSAWVWSLILESFS